MVNLMWKGLQPAAMMTAAQVMIASVAVLYRVAMNEGMSMPVLVAYRFLFAAATFLPLALIIDRKNRPPLTWKICFLAFFAALFGGSMAQNLFAMSTKLTSATLAMGMVNLVPAVTFILAVILRMEELGLRTRSGKAKLIGTTLCIGGAMILTFYKGIQLNFWSTTIDLLHTRQHAAPSLHRSGSQEAIGTVVALLFCLSLSISLIFQTKLSEAYPRHYSSTALTTILGSVQAVVYAVCTERDWSQWKLGSNIRLAIAAYMGIVALGGLWVCMMYCVKMKGPLFVSIFNPLSLVLVTLASSLLLNDKLHLGSVVGSAVIICGLYIVLWGKSKEIKKVQNKSSGDGEDESIRSFSYHSRVSDVVIALDSSFTMRSNSKFQSQVIPDDVDDQVHTDEGANEIANDLEASKVSSPKTTHALN